MKKPKDNIIIDVEDFENSSTEEINGFFEKWYLQIG